VSAVINELWSWCGAYRLQSVRLFVLIILLTSAQPATVCYNCLSCCWPCVAQWLSLSFIVCLLTRRVASYKRLLFSDSVLVAVCVCCLVCLFSGLRIKYKKRLKRKSCCHFTCRRHTALNYNCAFPYIIISRFRNLHIGHAILLISDNAGAGLTQLVTSLIASTKLINTTFGYYLDG